MESRYDEQQKVFKELRDLSIILLLNSNKTAEEVKASLITKGLDEKQASDIVSEAVEEIKRAKRERANNDMLYGGFFCIAGLVATYADFGFIFWGAILFGGLQFFKGLFKL